MSAFYTDPTRESDPHALPDAEAFFVRDACDCEGGATEEEAGHCAECGRPAKRGWYWFACFPGCLPDGDPNGPFATEAEAIADAREVNS